MDENETVKFNISIHIDAEGTVDTGLTVAEWNALTPERRTAIYDNEWSQMAGDYDNGGAAVVTPGAEGI